MHVRWNKMFVKLIEEKIDKKHTYVCMFMHRNETTKIFPYKSIIYTYEHRSVCK